MSEQIDQELLAVVEQWLEEGRCHAEAWPCNCELCTRAKAIVARAKAAQDFCQHCGARIPGLVGEGRCSRCAHHEPGESVDGELLMMCERVQQSMNENGRGWAIAWKLFNDAVRRAKAAQQIEARTFESETEVRCRKCGIVAFWDTFVYDGACDDYICCPECREIFPVKFISPPLEQPEKGASQ